MDKTEGRQLVMTCRHQASQLRRLSRLAGQRESGEIGMSWGALLTASATIEALCSAHEKAQKENERLGRSEAQLISERDALRDVQTSLTVES